MSSRRLLLYKGIGRGRGPAHPRDRLSPRQPGCCPPGPATELLGALWPPVLPVAQGSGPEPLRATLPWGAAVPSGAPAASSAGARVGDPRRR